MFLIIAGSRTYHQLNTLETAIADFGLTPEVIIHGAAQGVDTLAQIYAEQRGIFSVAFPAKWDLYGRKAGPIRNKIMAQRGDALLALWDGKSPGTKGMIKDAAYRGLLVFVKFI